MSSASPGEEVTLTWRNLTYDVPVLVKEGKSNNDSSDNDSKKRILHGLSGHCAAGQVVAVMGPSGSGKTSLIHILGGRRESMVSGDFVINGGAQTSTRSLLGEIGYVTQEDVLMTSLTTVETLRFATRLRLAARHLTADVDGDDKITNVEGKATKITRAEVVDAMVERAIEEFDLARCKNSPVGVQGQGGISGGEKRRLVIAMECVHRPKVLLLDEPTSGLDATTALLVIKKLRAIANGERGGHRAAVITSIHQPRSTVLPLFDYAILLADGREVYAGPTYQHLPGGGLSQDGVMGWLTDVGHPCPTFESPPDFLLDLINTRVEDNTAGGTHTPEEGHGPGGASFYAAPAPSTAPAPATAPATPEADADAELGTAADAVQRLRDRDVVVKELAAAWTTSERRAAYIRDGEEADERSRRAMKAKSTAGALRISNRGENRRTRHPVAVWCTQFGALFSRTFLYKLREPSVVASQFLNSVLIPLIVVGFYTQEQAFGVFCLGCVFLDFCRTFLFILKSKSASSCGSPYQEGSIYFRMSTTVSSSGDRLSAISLIVLLQSFMCFDQLLLFPKERGLFLHESNGGMYKTGVFYWARTLSEAWSIILFALICAVICYEMYGLHDSMDGRVTFYLVVTAVTVAGASFLTALGSLCKTFEQTNSLAGTILIVLMLFDGNWINRRNIPVYYRWLADVSFLGYAVEAAVVSDFKRVDFTCTDRAILEEGCMPITGKQMLRSLEFDEGATWPKFWLLILVTVLYRLVAFLGLHFCWTGQTFKERWTKLWA